MKKTPLYEIHVKYGGKIINFGGWALPVQYSGILEEHQKVRTAAGLFDVSHMGEIMVKGPGATVFLQKIVTNDLSKAVYNQVVYSPMCYLDGGVVDDLLIYKFNQEKYLLVVNAANREKDFQWLLQHADAGVKLKDVSEQYAQLALQGPLAERILQKIVNVPLKDLKFFRFLPEVNVAGIQALISRTGYTGEDGFEIYVSSADAPVLWEKMLSAGKNEGIVPVGLGARDTLRFEAVLPLYGQEISKEITPLEANLERFVKLDKEDFIGKSALLRQKEEGLARKLIGFEMMERGIPRSHYVVQKNGDNIGFVTSGSFSPTLKKNIGLAMVSMEHGKEGTELEVLIRNKVFKAKVVPIPFYQKRYQK